MGDQGNKWDFMALRPEKKSSAPNSEQKGKIEQGNKTFSFRGSSEHLIDEKGRVSVPIAFRENLLKYGVSSVVLTNFLSDGAHRGT